MEIRRTPPRYPRQGPSCLLVLGMVFAAAVGVFMISNAAEVRDAILPDPTPTPTRSPASYATSARLFERDGEYANAIRDYEAALALAPDNLDYLVPVIHLMTQFGQLENALQRAEAAIELAPDSDAVWAVKAAAHLAMGDRWTDMGQLDRAEVEYGLAVEAGRAATEINPSNAQAYAYMTGGLLALGIDNYAQAQDAIERAISLEPTNPDVQYYYAQVLINQGYYDAAQQELEVAVERHPTYTDMYISLAQIYYFIANERQRAILTLRDAAEMDPDNAAVYDLLAYFYLVAGQAPEAEDNARQAVELDPEMVRAHAHLGHAYYKGFNYSSAIEQLEIAVAGYGEPTADTSIYFAMLGLAYYFENAADCAKAIPYFEQALSVATPDSPGQISAEEGLELCRQYEITQP